MVLEVTFEVLLFALQACLAVGIALAAALDVRGLLTRWFHHHRERKRRQKASRAKVGLPDLARQLQLARARNKKGAYAGIPSLVPCSLDHSPTAPRSHPTHGNKHPGPGPKASTWCQHDILQFDKMYNHLNPCTQSAHALVRNIDAFPIASVVYPPCTLSCPSCQRKEVLYNDVRGYNLHLRYAIVCAKVGGLNWRG